MSYLDIDRHLQMRAREGQKFRALSLTILLRRGKSSTEAHNCLKWRMLKPNRKSNSMSTSTNYI